MAKEPIEITLGERTFKIRPLVAGQLRNFVPAFATFMEKGGKLSNYEAFDQAVSAILAVTSRDYPEFARSVFDETEMESRDILTALDILAFYSGVFKREEATSPLPLTPTPETSDSVGATSQD